MTHNIYIYILIMGGISYFIRVLPMTLIRKPLKNQFLQSFLYYVPYVTLAVMTFPAILHATQSPISGALALVVGVVAAWCGAGLLRASALRRNASVRRQLRLGDVNGGSPVAASVSVAECGVPMQKPPGPLAKSWRLPMA